MNIQTLNQQIQDWRVMSSQEPSKYMVREGTMYLKAWDAVFSERNDDWAVVHLVGGEEFEVCFEVYQTQNDAQDVAFALNNLPVPLIHHHERDWEG